MPIPSSCTSRLVWGLTVAVATTTFAFAQSTPARPAMTPPVTGKPVVQEVRRLPPVAPVTVVAPLKPGTAQAEAAQPKIPPGTDADGDGAVDVRVGGTDCNDQDGRVYPGATEIPNDRDEDCDPATIGELDQDRDGFTDARVSNPGGASGIDCDDNQAGINPNAQELPNRLDDNCDGIVDNLLGTWWTPR